MPGEMTFAINSKLLAQGVTASDAEVGAAVGFAFRELKLVVEPGGAVGLAALAGRPHRCQRQERRHRAVRRQCRCGFVRQTDRPEGDCARGHRSLKCHEKNAIFSAWLMRRIGASGSWPPCRAFAHAVGDDARAKRRSRRRFGHRVRRAPESADAAFPLPAPPARRRSARAPAAAISNSAGASSVTCASSAIMAAVSSNSNSSGARHLWAIRSSTASSWASAAASVTATSATSAASASASAVSASADASSAAGARELVGASASHLDRSHLNRICFNRLGNCDRCCASVGPAKAR